MPISLNGLFMPTFIPSLHSPRLDDCFPLPDTAPFRAARGLTSALLLFHSEKNKLINGVYKNVDVYNIQCIQTW